MQRTSWLIVLSLIFSILPAQAAPLTVGKVTASMGVAVVSGAVHRKVVQGMPLYVGDVLKTGKGGHIHLRMVDEALVSLRPNSKLKITSYSYQSGLAESIKIRFDLLYGTVRSVTGKGGHLAKDRFRMNTPVAAIGVRGTDFIAQADVNQTLVHVASGAIVLAPLGVGCQASSLGECQTGSARVLTAEMHDMMLEFTRGMTVPQLVPLVEQLQAGNLQTPAAPAHATVEAQTSVVAQKETLNTLVAQQLVPVTPAPSVTPATPVHNQMVWGRWSWAKSGSDLGIPMKEAAKGREITVGSSTSGLFRDRAGPMSLPQSGRTEFILRSAQVSLPQPSGAIAGQVQNGTLGVDFNAASFNTKLNITHPSLQNPVALTAVGRVRDDGLMYSTVSNGHVAGSLSRTGVEAGYLFTLPTQAGTLQGTTLWNK